MPQISRRSFMQHGLGGATLLATGWSLPRFLAQTARAAAAGADQRVLVVVQLSGGNDGLNTVIPYVDDLYQKARPTLCIAPVRVLRLSDTLGVHPDMAGFKRLFDDNLLKVVMNVGYPNPDRSHFRSMDIWHTAALQPESAKDGWLGRVVDTAGTTGHTGDSSVSAPSALHVDDESLPLALRTQRVAVPSIRDIAAFRLQGDADAIESAAVATRDAASDDLLFVQRTMIASCENARRIENVIEKSPARRPYPAYGLATRLQQIAQLIGADFGPRIYYTSMGGFDTHARQALAHGPLLRELADSVASFYNDLRERGLADRVLLLTFSEFGRRVAENAGQGTDHGAAAPMFLAGPAVGSGIVGGSPNLSQQADGDVPHALDFRSVYASVLEDWLDIRSAQILGGRFEPASILV